MHVKTQISLHLDNSHLNPEASANLAAHGLSIDLCKSTHKPHPRCNDSLFQGAIPKHEAITEIDLGFSFISGFFFWAGTKAHQGGTAGLQLWPLCVQKSFHISRSKTTGSKRFSCYWGTGAFSNPVISVSCLLAAGLLPLSISGAIQ